MKSQDRPRTEVVPIEKPRPNYKKTKSLDFYLFHQAGRLRVLLLDASGGVKRRSGALFNCFREGEEEGGGGEEEDSLASFLLRLTLRFRHVFSIQPFLSFPAPPFSFLSLQWRQILQSAVTLQPWHSVHLLVALLFFCSTSVFSTSMIFSTSSSTVSTSDTVCSLLVTSSSSTSSSPKTSSINEDFKMFFLNLYGALMGHLCRFVFIFLLFCAWPRYGCFVCGKL